MDFSRPRIPSPIRVDADVFFEIAAQVFRSHAPCSCARVKASCTAEELRHPWLKVGQGCAVDVGKEVVTQGCFALQATAGTDGGAGFALLGRLLKNATMAAQNLGRAFDERFGSGAIDKGEIIDRRFGRRHADPLVRLAGVGMNAERDETDLSPVQRLP